MICVKCMAPVKSELEVCPKCGASIKKEHRTDYKKALNISNDWQASQSVTKKDIKKTAKPMTKPMTKPTVKPTVKSSVKQKPTAKEPEHLVPWLLSEAKKSISTLPKRGAILGIYAAIILGVNLIFWGIDPYFMPAFLQPFRKLISTVVFLTATYNDVVPKTIFWVLVFTFGKKLFKTIRKRGFIASFSCMKNTIPQFKQALGRLGTNAYGTLLLGAGLGLIVANNFASYSRFSGARNKFDKYFIVLVIAFTISYVLGEANKTGIFKFVKLASKDIAKLSGKGRGLSDDGIYVILSGFILGLLLDAPLILIKWMYGGYILGFIAVVAAVVLSFAGPSKTEVKS